MVSVAETTSTVAQHRAQEKDTQMAAKHINRAVANELWVQLCAARGTCWLPVLTDSMMPLLQPGDQVQVSRIVAEEIRFGDIVVFRRGDDLIVHRVLKK